MEEKLTVTQKFSGYPDVKIFSGTLSDCQSEIAHWRKYYEGRGFVVEASGRYGIQVTSETGVLTALDITGAK